MNKNAMFNLIVTKQKFVFKLVIIAALLLLGLMVSACVKQPVALEVAEIAAGGGEDSLESKDTQTEPIGETTVDDISEAVVSRTPVPTLMPGYITRGITELTQSTGLAGRTFLGLTIENWGDILISVLIVMIGYIWGPRLLGRLLNWVLKAIKLEGGFLDKVATELKRLVLLFFARFSVLRLNFWSDSFRIFLNDIFFSLTLVLYSIIVFKLIDFTLRNYKKNIAQDEQDRLAPVLTLAKRFLNLIALVVFIGIAFSHFGINVNMISSIIIVVGVMLSLGAQDTISDLIGSYIILIDQPFRIGDAILIKDLDTWGYVLSIGTRTTHIRTKDNREVIIPNSKISQSQVINYTYPDPSYRLQTDIGVSYESDLIKTRQVIKEALRKVEGVLPDKPVDVLYIGFGDSTRNIRVRWWIEEYRHERFMQDKVNSAIEVVLNEAGIDMPFNTYALNVKMEDQNILQAKPGSDKKKK